MADFEKASRMRLFFDCSIGRLSVEDLWTMRLSDLDKLAVGLQNMIKTDNSSFIDQQKPDEGLQLSFDIARHIIDVRLAERAAALKTKQKAEHTQKILSILARKQDEKLEQASEDELREMLDSL